MWFFFIIRNNRRVMWILSLIWRIEKTGIGNILSCMLEPHHFKGKRLQTCFCMHCRQLWERRKKKESVFSYRNVTKHKQYKNLSPPSFPKGHWHVLGAAKGDSTMYVNLLSQVASRTWDWQILTHLGAPTWLLSFLDPHHPCFGNHLVNVICLRLVHHQSTIGLPNYVI